jgi:hypothetical protein
MYLQNIIHYPDTVHRQLSPFGYPGILLIKVTGAKLNTPNPPRGAF